jgi:hypothetical protein
VTKPNGKTYTGYWLWMRAHECERFHKDIGFVGKRKSVYKASSRKLKKFDFSDRVKSVSPCGRQTVFDILVEPSHAFSANGLLSHNCPEVAFQISGSPAFPRDELAYAESTIKPPLCRGSFVRTGPTSAGFKFVKQDTGPWFIWKFPFDANGRSDQLKYYGGADAALGMEEGDFASIAMLCGQTGEFAARFAERVPPEVLADQMDMVGRYYNMAIMNPELTGNLGRWALIKLRDVFRYPNIYSWKGRDDRKRGKSKSIALGFEMNQATRRLIIDACRNGLRMGIRQEAGALVVNDRALMSQMSLCTLKEWRWEVLRGHDDILVAFMIACLTREQYPPMRMQFAPKNTMEETPLQKLQGVTVKPEKSEIESQIIREMGQMRRRAGLDPSMRGTGRKVRDRLIGI